MHLKKFLKPASHPLIEFAGWYGVVAVLMAYMLVSFGKLAPTHLAYPILNGTGAVGLVIDAMYRKDYPPAVLNIIWVIVAVAALIRFWIQI